MRPLVERGRAKLSATLVTIPIELRPIGYTTLTIVCQEDFGAHALLCLAHAVANGRTVYVLTPEGRLCAMLAAHHWMV